MSTEFDYDQARKQKLLENLRIAIGEDNYRNVMSEISAARAVEMVEYLCQKLGDDAFYDLLKKEGLAEVFALAIEQTILDARSKPAERRLKLDQADDDADTDWKREIAGFYPFLSWKSPISVPLGEQLHRASVQPLKPLFDSIYKMVWILFRGLNEIFPGLLEPPHKVGWLFRQTPSVLVCMPFHSEQPEIAYRLVVKPLVERFFGGKCVRLTHPTVGDWRRDLRRELLYSHLAVFDLSFDNESVRLEKEYYDAFAKATVEKRYICISYMWDRPPLIGERRLPRPKVSADCLYYDCSDDDLIDFAEQLTQRMRSELVSIGFRKGIMDPWVIYPQPPPAGLDVDTIDTEEEAAQFEKEWVENIRFRHADFGLGSEPTALQTIDSRDRELNAAESLLPVSVTLEGYPAPARFVDVLDAFAETWRMANDELSRRFGDNWCVPPNLDSAIDASIGESHIRAELQRTKGNGHVMIQGSRIALMLLVKDEIGREFLNQKTIIECFHRCWCKVVGIPLKLPKLQKLTIRLRGDGTPEVTSPSELEY